MGVWHRHQRVKVLVRELKIFKKKRKTTTKKKKKKEKGEDKQKYNQPINQKQ